MRVEYVYRELDGRKVVRRRDGKGVVCLAVPEELRFPWLRAFIDDLTRRTFTIGHPQGKEWYVVFQLDYQPKSRPTGRLLIRPSVDESGHCVPYIGLVRDYPLSSVGVQRRLVSFLRQYHNS